MGTGDIPLGVTVRWTSIPSRAEQQYFQLLQATETGISSGCVGLIGSCATLPTFNFYDMQGSCLPPLTYFFFFLSSEP